jgi:hypothetical protein
VRVGKGPQQVGDVSVDMGRALLEEEIWLGKQKSRQTCRVYWLDVRHFMPAFGITTT